MILGVTLIIVGILGSIVTIIFGIRFMKNNSFILKGNYVEYSIEEEHKEIKNNPIDINSISDNLTEILDEGNDTVLLDTESYDTQYLEEINKDDTEIL